MINDKWIILTIVLACIGVWYIFEDKSTFFMYGDTYFKWVHYFLFMVVGAYIGAKKITLDIHPVYDLIGFIASLIGYYAILYLSSKFTIIVIFR